MSLASEVAGDDVSNAIYVGVDQLRVSLLTRFSSLCGQNKLWYYGGTDRCKPATAHAKHRRVYPGRDSFRHPGAEASHRQPKYESFPSFHCNPPVSRVGM
jgi:hypothetical protein